MKKQLLLTAMAVGLTLSAFSQTEKGDNLIGGSIGFDHSTRKPLNSGNSMTSGNSKSFNVAPRFGHFFAKNLAVGLQVGYSENRSDSQSIYYQGSGPIQTSNSTTKYNSLNVIPYVRYYVDIADKFKFFGQGNFGMAFGKSKYTSTYSGNNSTQTQNYKDTQYLASINPGFSFFPSKKWAIEFSFPLISYNKYSLKDDGYNVNSEASSNESVTFGFSSFSPSIGFNFHF